MTPCFAFYFFTTGICRCYIQRSSVLILLASVWSYVKHICGSVRFIIDKTIYTRLVVTNYCGD